MTASAVKNSPSPPPSRVCLYAGATLTVAFDKSTGGLGTGTPGPWVPPLAVTPSGILTVVSTVWAADHMTTVFRTVSTGTATVSAQFDNECSAGASSPCTIPPLSGINLIVQVVNS
jgi:hypothetical protein